MQKQEYINKYWQDALNATANTPIFPILVICESADESAWGESDLSKSVNNFLGLKSTESWEESGGKFVLLPTHENVNGKVITVQAKFRKYDTVEDCFKNYVHFVTQPRYVATGVPHAKTPEEQIQLIAKGGYATDPNYAEKVIALIKELTPMIPA